MAQVIVSANGVVSHIPISPKMLGSTHKKNKMRTKLRKMETSNAALGLPMDVKKAIAIMLYPFSKNARENILRPSLPIDRSSLLLGEKI